jgi:uncharacterized protein YndB with AHSA1/START domain
VISAERTLLSERPDVWSFVAEPFNLPDWWPAYQAVRPDRRGVAEGARWTATARAAKIGAIGLVRRPVGEITLELRRVVPGYELRWLDSWLGMEAGIALDNAGSGRTRATVFLDGSWWRGVLSGQNRLPKEAVGRLYDLCQTAAPA